MQPKSPRKEFPEKITHVRNVGRASRILYSWRESFSWDRYAREANYATLTQEALVGLSVTVPGCRRT